MFTYFWDTKFTIPDGYGFSQFSLMHIAELLLCALLCYICAKSYVKKDENGRMKMLKVIAVLLVIDEIAKYAVTAACGNFRVDFLPFHLCSINIFVIAAYVLHPDERLAEWLYAGCLPTAIIALLCPSWASLPVMNFMHLHSLSCHILLTMFPVLLLTGGFRPKLKRFLSDLPYAVPVVIFVYIFNKIFGTNFMFLNGGSTGGTGNPLSFLETYLGSFYLLGIPAIAVILYTVVYGIPYLISKRKVKTI